MKKIKVYFRSPAYYGPAYHYTVNRLLHAAKDFVEVTSDWLSADLIILKLIGDPGRENLVSPQERGFSNDLYAIYDLFDVINKKVVMIPLCNIVPTEFFAKMFTQSMMTYSYLNVPCYMDTGTNIDLGPEMLKYRGRGINNFVRGPLGVDPAHFYMSKEELPKPFLIYCFGYDEKTESIDIIFEAIKKVNSPLKMLHSGRDLKYDSVYYQHVPPVQLGGFDFIRQKYWASYYVNALRRDAYKEGGFELSNLEGPLCGTVPITYDFECYRYWFDGMSQFVSYENTLGDLCNLFSNALDKVLVGKPLYEKEWLLESKEKIYSQFTWKKVAGLFWEKILKEFNF